MHPIPVTTLTAGVLGLIFVVLAVRVVTARMAGKVMLGDGPNEAGSGDGSGLLTAIRGHGNFAEYVPLSLILIGLMEASNGATVLVKVLCGALVLARVAHPIGLTMKAPNALRAIGFFLTLLVVVVGALAAILRVV